MPPARADATWLDAELALRDALADASLARLEVDLQLHVAEYVEPDGVKERDPLAVTRGRANEDPHSAPVARLLHDPLGERESDAPSAVILRDDNRLEFSNSAMPNETRIADDPPLVFRDEDPPLEAKLAAYLGAGIESSVRSDQLLEQRTAYVAVVSLEVAHDHRTTLVSLCGERRSIRLAVPLQPWLASTRTTRSRSARRAERLGLRTNKFRPLNVSVPKRTCGLMPRCATCQFSPRPPRIRASHRVRP